MKTVDAATFQANIYPQPGPNPTTANADQVRANVGICFSGGGSRALTCAWGQMIGMRQVRNAAGASVLDCVRYISSVSGGSWAAVPYTFLPAAIPDTDFFPPYTPPQLLHLNAAPPGGVDVSQMGATALGAVPQRFANLFELDPFKNIVADFVAIVLLSRQDLDVSLKWLWLYIIGTNVLSPFGLYGYGHSLLHPDRVPWNYPGAKAFSLSTDYVKTNILDNGQHPSADAFQLVAAGDHGAPARPMLIVNTNIIGTPCPGVEMMAPLQVPVQITPVSGGSFGTNPCLTGDIVGGGSVESFLFTSTLSSSHAGSATGTLNRTYELADITACSSAFFASVLAQNLRDVLQRMLAMSDEHVTGLLGRLVEEGERLVASDLRARLQAMSDRAQQFQASDLVPQYTYWPVASAAEGPGANAPTQFTDGGDLENTGIVGLLAQTDVDTIIAFDATSTPLVKTGNTVVVSPDFAPLFGLAYDEGSKRFAPYKPGGVNPFTDLVDPKGFLQVFDNAGGEFDALAQALYAANGSGAQSGPAFCRQSLSVVANPLAGIAARSSPLTVLWVQNARVHDWQSGIADPALAGAIAHGQSTGGLSDFADFPYYSTFTKVHQTAAETNALAQMWAWCTGDSASPLRAALTEVTFGTRS